MGTMILIWLLMAVPMFFWGPCGCCVADPQCNGCAAGTCWEITVAGVTGSATCQAMNGTFVLDETFVDPFCFWKSSVFGSISTTCNACTGTGNTWRIVAGGDQLIMHCDGALGATGDVLTYTIDGEFDCDGPNVYDLASNQCPGSCGSFPASITATKVACP